MLRCELCSTCYTAVRIKYCSKSTSVIEVATMKNTDDFHYEEKPSRTTAKLTSFTVSKDEWDKGGHWYVHEEWIVHILWYAKRHVSG